MTHYIETQAKDGSLIRIEVEDTSKPVTGFTRKSETTNVSGEMAKDVYQHILQTIGGCATGIVDTVQNMPSLPSTASVDFAIKVDADAGPMIAKSRDEAQFRISLTWKQIEPEEGVGDK